jgi:hypothetical protein
MSGGIHNSAEQKKRSENAAFSSGPGLRPLAYVYFALDTM